MVSEEFARTEDKGDHTNNFQKPADRIEDKPSPARCDTPIEPVLDMKALDDNLSAGDISFYGKDNVETLRICSNGDFIVNGRKATNDMEVYHAMKRFLATGNAQEQ